jgi:hypothetical protein
MEITSETQITNHLLHNQSTNHPLTHSDISFLLEWAGEKLLSLPIKSSSPRSYRNNWPDYLNSSLPNYFSGKTLTPIPPNHFEIDLMDNILSLVTLIPDSISRNIINSRCLISPITHKHLFPWSQISRLLNLSSRTTHRSYDFGINQILKTSNKTQLIQFINKIQN